METLADIKARVGTPVTRLLLTLNAAVIVQSVGTVIGIWFTPSGHYGGGSLGNRHTCDFQGFIIVFGIQLSGVLDGGLSILYVLMICCNWRPRSLVRVEIATQVLAWVIALGTSVGALIMTSYNPLIGICFPAAYPVRCRDDKEGVECERGERSLIFTALTGFVVVLVSIISAISMIALYLKVRKSEDRNAQYNFSPARDREVTGASSSHRDDEVASSRKRVESATSREKSIAVGIQGLYFASTYLLVKSPIFAVALVFGFLGLGNAIVAGIALSISTLTGVAYLVVFMRKRQTMRTRLGRFIRDANARCCPAFVGEKSTEKDSPRKERCPESATTVLSRSNSSGYQPGAPTL